MKNKEILDRLISDFKQFDEIEAIALSGSSTTKAADNKSDFDIYIYCTKEPSVKKRENIIKKYANKAEIDNHYFETGDVFIFKETQKPVDIMYRSPDWIEENIKRVWEDGNASLGYTTCFIYNVNKSKILYDKNGWFATLQNKTKTPYPKKLAKNIIEKNFNFLKDVMFSYYDQLLSSVERKDFVSINHRVAAFLASYFDIINEKNKILHPGEKKLVEFAKNNCNILPSSFEEDVNNLVICEVSKKLGIADRLVENLRKIL